MMTTLENSPHVLRPRQQRSRDALVKIVQAAEHILRTEGPDGFSVAAVAHVSGLPVGNIYRRFRSKEDILLALKDDVTSRVERAVMEKVGSRFARVDDFVSDFVLAFVNTIAQDETIHRALFDPRLRTPAMEQIGSGGRRRIFLHYSGKMREFLSALDAKRAETIIAVSFNIIAYAVVGRAAGVDPLLKSFSWETIVAEYTSAAVGYIKHGAPTAEENAGFPSAAIKSRVTRLAATGERKARPSPLQTG
jgi:AcrR family transcriptional regulator